MRNNSRRNSESSMQGSETSHPYFTRLSVKNSMLIIHESGDNQGKPRENQRKTRSDLSLIYQRTSNASLGIGRNSRTSLPVIQNNNSSYNTPSEGNSAPPSPESSRNSSAILPIGSRRNSYFLETDQIDYPVARCEKNFEMSCSSSSHRFLIPQRTWGFISCLVALGAIIIIAVPVAKIMGSIKKDISNIYNEVSGLKKQHGGYPDSSGVSEKHSKSNANLPKEYSAEIKKIVREEMSYFDWDKTGKSDYALESAGGRIIKTIDTTNYGSSVGFLGITLCDGSNGPRAIIQSNSAPGECWAFKGSKGAVVIKLLGKISVDSVSLEHIPARISPTGKLESAPKKFSVYALRNNQKKFLLGSFEYKLNGNPIQTFPVKSCEPIEYVELDIESNHGSPDYTCVYRFRVHGTLQKL